MSEYVIAKYIRLSVEDAKSDSMSIANQRLLLDRHIQALDIPNADILEFVDNGRSGTDFDRLAVQQLLNLVSQGNVHCILVKDFSRFGRNMIETAYYIERVFPLYRVRFISVSDGYDSDDFIGGTGGIEVAFKFLLHEQYSRDLSKKIKSAKHAKMLRGEAVTKNCLFGYKLNDERQMVIDEPTADTVRLIFSLASEGFSLTQIAERLHQEQRPTPSQYKGRNRTNDCIWTLSGVRSVMQEEQYIGTYVAGKTKKADVGSKTVIKVPELEWIRIPNHHPAIVDEATFNAVQERNKHQDAPQPKRPLGTWQRYRNTSNPLKGKVICGSCGHAMTRSITKNAAFHCIFTRSAPEADCYRHRVLTSEIEHTVLEQLQRRIYGYHKGTDPVPSDAQADCQTRQAEHSTRALYEALILGEIDAATYEMLKSQAESEADANRNSPNPNLHRNSESLPDDVTCRTIQKAQQLDQVPSTLIDSLIDRVLLFPNGRIDIFWK